MNDAVKGPLFGVVALLVAGGALAFVSMGQLGENLVYYWSPTELVDAGDKAQGATVRLGGMVVPGSVDWPPGEAGSFEVTDGDTTVRIRSQGVPPQMFREGIGVVVEGTYAAGGVFETDRVMIKHSNEYRAPEDMKDGHDVQQMYRTLVTEDS